MRATHQATTPDRAGFTLMEVVVAIAIVGLLMGAALGTIRYTMTARNLVDNWSLSEKEGPAIVDLLMDDLESILFYNIEPEKVFRCRDNGTIDLMDFICIKDQTSPPREKSHDLPAPVDYCEVGYRCRINEQDDRYFELWRREDLGIDEETTAGGTYQLLSKRIKAFDFTFYKKAGEFAEEFYEWPPDEETFGLPYRMTLRLTIEVPMREVPVERVQRLLTYRRNYVFPKEQRWAMKRRVRPYIPDEATAAGPGQPGEGAGPTSGEGPGASGAGAALPGLGQRGGGRGGANPLQGAGGRGGARGGGGGGGDRGGGGKR